ncbi:MAG: response regulator [Clostridiaceae bacterium]|nr:response regulator [Clostridiaceae bacterium]
MLHILVVDDEESIRYEVMNCIREILGEEIRLSEAENGIEAVGTVCSEPVDLVLADVKMPLCTGVEMLEKLKDLQYKGLVVMISGFDDYDLVRQAMRMGAVDYLLKPLVLEEFAQVLKSCVKKINMQSIVHGFEPSILENMEKQFFMQQKSITRLLSGSERETVLFREYSLCEDQLFWLVILDALQNNLNREADKQLLFVQLKEAMSHIDGMENWVAIQGEYKGFWAMAFFSKKQCGFPADQIIPYFNINRIKYGISPKPAPARDLPAQYGRCIRALDQFFYDMPGTGMGISDLGEKFPYEKAMERLADTFCEYDLKGFSSLLKRLFLQAGSDAAPVSEFKQQLMNLIYSIMGKSNSFIQTVSDYKFTEYDIILTIRNVTSASQLHKDMIRIMDLYLTKIVEKLSGHDDYTIQKAKKYIEENFNQDLSLQSTASYLGFHPNYFSTLFKSKTGSTFSQYLQNLRIEKACELIHSTNLNLYEIGERIGYSDNANFCRAFKKVKGVSPSKFKNSSNLND